MSKMSRDSSASSRRPIETLHSEERSGGGLEVDHCN